MHTRDKERYREWQRRKMREQKAGRKMDFEYILYRIGEAPNPGPSHKGHNKQSKFRDFFHQHHTKKDEKYMRCKEKGYTIENIAGDGKCLYA
eukprot:9419707-Heterocapsa_arctica.AAC.1